MNAGKAVSRHCIRQQEVTQLFTENKRSEEVSYQKCLKELMQVWGLEVDLLITSGPPTPENLRAPTGLTLLWTDRPGIRASGRQVALTRAFPGYANSRMAAIQRKQGQA